MTLTVRQIQIAFKGALARARKEGNLKAAAAIREFLTGLDGMDLTGDDTMDLDEVLIVFANDLLKQE